MDKKTFKKIMLLIIFALLLFWVLNDVSKFLTLMGGLYNVIKPLVLGGCIAFILNTILTPLEKLWGKIWRKKPKIAEGGFKRPVCLITSLLLVLGIIFAVCFIVIPYFVEHTASFVSSLPQYFTNLDSWWDKVVAFFDKFMIVLPEININHEEIITKIGTYIAEKGGTLVNATFNVTTSILSVVVNIVLGFAFAIYILAQKEKLGKQFTKLFGAILPQKTVDKILGLARLSHNTFSRFVTGQLTEAVIFGVLTFIGMLIFNMPFASVISVLVGFTTLVPMVGAFIGTALGAFLILLVNPVKAFWFIVFIIILQQLDNNLIYPRVMGKSIGLSGLWVLAAVTIGGNLAGVAGMLIGVPLSSVIYVLLSEFVNKKLAAKKTEEEQSNGNCEENTGN
ncbi:MAG: AI-2E family transporter [Clostridia bacterium]|nr:AI-2E family transporter [Clostridia bacterium]